MQGAYCPTCDLMFDSGTQACPDCGGSLEAREDFPPLPVDPSKGSIQSGIGLLCLLHLIQLLFLPAGPEMLLFAGITQFLYVIPAVIVLAMKGRTRTLGGVLIGAGGTFFLNAAIFGVLCASMIDSGY
jgi:hypothetical protein